MINPPKLEICFEGYNTDQTDFYIGQLIEKINILENLSCSLNKRIASLESENDQLRNELIALIKQSREGNSAESYADDNNVKSNEHTDAMFNESKNEINSVIRESLKSLQIELNSVKEFIKNN